MRKVKMIKEEKLIKMLTELSAISICGDYFVAATYCDHICENCPVNSDYDYQKTLKRILKNE